MKKFKNLFLVCFTLVTLFALTSCLAIDQNTTLQFTTLPEEQYVVDQYSEEEFKETVKITVNGEQVVSLAALEKAGATVSKIDFTTPGKQTIIISYEGALLTFEFYVVRGSTFVAQIGDTNYKTIQEAFAAVEANGEEVTIKLVGNQIIRNASNYVVTVKANQKVKLDLNGYSVKGYFQNDKSVGLVKITANGQLTVEDNSAEQSGALVAEGMYDSDPYNVSLSVISNQQGNLIINSGNIINECGYCAWGAYAIDNLTNGGNGEATLTINGGYVKSTAYRAIRLFANGTQYYNTAIINGGTIESPNNNAIWVQQPNANPNLAKLVVGSNATVISGGEYEGTPRYSISVGNSEAFIIEISADANINHKENFKPEWVK